ncbi:hypothetical protein GCM10022278_15760 [Allohahella marinimesophila]|uniref:diguanylate cyclase n=2 Tax=Allohahella marinimesophila TaxID=1054972 RepID=A0ABP7P1I7_9GAMM
MIRYCCLLLLLVTHFAAANTVILEDGQKIQLGQQIEYLKDADGMLSIDQVRALDDAQWQTSEQDILNFGYTSATYWLRFSLSHAGSAAERHLLEIAYPVLDQIDTFIYRDGVLQNHFEMGDRLPFHARPIEHPHFVIPLALPPHQDTEIYLRVQSSSSVQVPMAIWHGDALLEHSYVEALGRALFYGAMLVMAIYNLLIFVSVRETSYLWYVLHVTATLFLLASMQGVTFQLLWPESTVWNDRVLLVALSGMLSFPCMFVRSFLKIPQSRPKLARVLLVLGGLGLVTTAGAFVLPYRIMIVGMLLCIIVVIMCCLWAGIVRWRDGFHAAKFYLSAWIFLLMGGILVISNKMGMLPRNWLTENAAQLGAGAEIVLLSFALAYRMNHERQMRNQAQKESADAQRRLLEHQMQANEELDRIVRERTEALEQANAQLTKISSTDALTGVMNRRALDSLFELEYKRAYRDKSPIAIIMIDLDHFKQINDTHGHHVGDLCLARAAEIIRSCIRRPPDNCARWGGEEFVVLLPNTDLDGAVTVAETIIAKFAESRVCHDELSLKMAASMGAASHVPQDAAGREDLLKQADELLYVAKANGRNRVEFDNPRKRTANN